MRPAVVLALGVVGVAACSRAPRGAAFFEAHAGEAERIVAACAKQASRGAECANAEAGLTAARRKARMETYRKNF